MSSPTTQIEIISNVSILLGNREITDLSTAGAFGVAAESAYDLLLDAEIGTNRWRFAAKTEELSLIGALSPDFAEWNYEYQLPADYLSMQRLFPNIPYEIFGDRVYTGSSTSVSAEYYSSSPAVTLWSAPFKAYFTYLLASHLAVSTTENDRVIAKINDGLTRWSAFALFSSSTSRPNRPLASQRYITVRF